MSPTLIILFVYFAAPQPGLFGLQSTSQERIVNPLIQECLDAVTEHQRLRLLMKGEWFKGLLPLSSVRSDAIVQRIRGKFYFWVPSFKVKSTDRFSSVQGAAS